MAADDEQKSDARSIDGRGRMGRSSRLLGLIVPSGRRRQMAVDGRSLLSAGNCAERHPLSVDRCVELRDEAIGGIEHALGAPETRQKQQARPARRTTKIAKVSVDRRKRTDRIGLRDSTIAIGARRGEGEGDRKEKSGAQRIPAPTRRLFPTSRPARRSVPLINGPDRRNHSNRTDNLNQPTTNRPPRPLSLLASVCPDQGPTDYLPSSVAIGEAIASSPGPNHVRSPR